MIFKINYKVNGYEDSVIITGETIEDVRENVKAFFDDRGIEPSYCWSEQL